MIDNFFKFPVSDTIVSREGLKGIEPRNIGSDHSSFLLFQYEHTHIRVYFENDNQLFKYYNKLEIELDVKIL